MQKQIKKTIKRQVVGFFFVIQQKAAIGKAAIKSRRVDK